MKLNIGCGGMVMKDWVNVDRGVPEGPSLGDGYGFMLHDLLDIPWPFNDASAECAVAHHVLDLFSPFELILVLGELARVLALGAVLRVSCANIELGIHRAMAGDAEWFAEQHGGLEETLGFFITQGGARKTLLTAEGLGKLCRDAGFGHAYAVDHNVTYGPNGITLLDSRLGESWFLEAIR